MKKLSLMWSVVGLAAVLLSSCGREQEPAIQKTITVQLEPNQEYTLILPENIRKDVYEFSTQASHYSMSSLGKNGSGQQIYQYIPALNYMGNDQVVVRNDQELEEDQQCGEHQDHHEGPGGCFGGGEKEDHYVVTINFKIGREVSAVSTAWK